MRRLGISRGRSPCKLLCDTPQELAATLVDKCRATAETLAEPADAALGAALRLRLAAQLARHASSVVAPPASSGAASGNMLHGSLQFERQAGRELDTPAVSAATRELVLAYELLQRAHTDAPATTDAAGLAQLEAQVGIQQLFAWSSEAVQRRLMLAGPGLVYMTFPMFVPHVQPRPGTPTAHPLCRRCCPWPWHTSCWVMRRPRWRVCAPCAASELVQMAKPQWAHTLIWRHTRPLRLSHFRRTWLLATWPPHRPRHSALLPARALTATRASVLGWNWPLRSTLPPRICCCQVGRRKRGGRSGCCACPSQAKPRT